MNVLFLDVDGVLNWSDFRKMSSNCDVLDEFCCERIEELVKRFDLKIVVSSTWRHYSPLMKILKNRFKIYGVTGDIDPTLRQGKDYYSTRSRGTLITHWLNSHSVDNYIIIDDVVWDMEEHSNVIHTNDDLGFTEECMQEALDMCNERFKI